MQKKIFMIAFIALSFQCSLQAQQVSSERIHFVPFASKNNIVELYIADDEDMINATIVMEGCPSWIHVSPLQQMIPYRMKGNRLPVRFTFDINETAPVGVTGLLCFTYTGISGKPIVKEIKISVSAPTQTVLFQNYPNPFNPLTVIRYQLSINSYVSLKVFDLLGREVTTLVDGVQEPGLKSVEWNAHDVVSGVYFFRLSTGEYFDMKRMILLR